MVVSAGSIILTMGIVLSQKVELTGAPIWLLHEQQAFISSSLPSTMLGWLSKSDMKSTGGFSFAISQSLSLIQIVFSVDLYYSRMYCMASILFST